MDIRSVKQVELIEIRVVKGNGTQEDPTRVVTQYWTHSNRFVFELDSI